MKLSKSQLRQIIREELLAERSSGDRTLDKKLNAAHKALSMCDKALTDLDYYLDDNYLGDDFDQNDALYSAVRSVEDHLRDVDESIDSLLNMIDRISF